MSATASPPTIQTIRWPSKEAAPQAFPERQALMPIWGGVPVPMPRWQKLWQSQIARSLDTDGLAYLHIPFCANHCVFCGFYRNAWKEEQGGAYVDKVIEEPLGGAHRNHGELMQRLREVLAEQLRIAQDMPLSDLLDRRFDRIMAYGQFVEK